MDTKLCAASVWLSLLLILTVGWTLTGAQQQQRPDFNPCLGKTECGECIGVAAFCAWCQKEVYTSIRCDMLANHQANGCDNVTDLVNPNNEMQILMNNPVRDAQDIVDRAIQIQPQRLSLKLRPNKPFRIPVKFRQAANYPVDLYFLMDLSRSMKDDQQKTAELAANLAKNMLNLTNNVRFGFGSFVDKIALPFTSTEPSKLKNPCSDCGPPYSFRHLLSLTPNVTQFKNIVDKGEISGNLDSPEGGLDAMMQVLACRKEIGWRDVSRKLLIYSSDASFHSAGDGKLAGIVMPNDGQCHLDDKGLYTEDLNQDYPSVGQMREIIREKKINVIFAIPRSYSQTYKGLSEVLEGSTVGTLSQDSGNIVELVRENYKKISSTVELRANNTDGVTISYQSMCLGYACGVCKCNEGRRGRLCECEESQLDDNEQQGNCQHHNSSLLCSGHGECVCGQCFCNPRSPNSVERFSGDYCQCDDYSCDLYQEMLCGGPTRGRCQCGTCLCNPGYNGTSCDCPISQDTCLAPNGAVCNGQGECNCGKCKCDKESRCYGDFCEHCPSCVGVCNCNKDCVNCRLFKRGLYSAEECENKCGNISITEVDVIEDDDNGTICQELFGDQTDCTFKFSYEYGTDNRLRIRTQKVIVCAEPVDIRPIIGGVVGSVLAGLLGLLIWKVCVTVYDGREYSRFKEEIENARWASVSQCDLFILFM
ncbi:integrin beta-PS-like [Liolophura sinensis]|uniref:integrin beta-PS-like n=1 Tax=Liolophura sinensis TaxID=3198878 RepID=UPI0031580005